MLAEKDTDGKEAAYPSCCGLSGVSGPPSWRLPAIEPWHACDQETKPPTE